jgi:hypothetical protein
MFLGRWLSIAALAGVLTGCGCASWQKWATVNRDLHRQNSARAEPAMRRAAARFGATLTSVAPRAIVDAPCDSLVAPDIPPEANCISWQSADGRLFRFHDAGGRKHLVIPLDSPSWSYARVARNGNHVVLLVPKVHPHKVGNGTRCQCSDTHYPEPVSRYGFVFDDFEPDGLDVVEVPMTEDYVAWWCGEVLAQSTDELRSPSSQPS